MRTIPLFGVPCLTSGDLLLRLVRSIDFPVETLSLINNGPDPSMRDAVREIQKSGSPFLRKIDVYAPGTNLGVAGSWNYFIRTYPVEWIFIASADIVFDPGDLRRMMKFQESNPGAKFIDGKMGFNFFLLKRSLIRRTGLFDENFYPAYYEDDDFEYRIKLACEQIYRAPFINARHGTDVFNRSCSIHANPEFEAANRVTYPLNHEYYIRKWGGVPGEEAFIKPFNDAQKKFTEWALDLDMRQKTDVWPIWPKLRDT